MANLRTHNIEEFTGTTSKQPIEDVILVTRRIFRTYGAGMVEKSLKDPMKKLIGNVAKPDITSTGLRLSQWLIRKYELNVAKIKRSYVHDDFLLLLLGKLLTNNKHISNLRALLNIEPPLEYLVIARTTHIEMNNWFAKMETKLQKGKRKFDQLHHQYALDTAIKRRRINQLEINMTTLHKKMQHLRWS